MDLMSPNKIMICKFMLEQLKIDNDTKNIFTVILIEILGGQLDSSFGFHLCLQQQPSLESNCFANFNSFLLLVEFNHLPILTPTISLLLDKTFSLKSIYFGPHHSKHLQT